MTFGLSVVYAGVVGSVLAGMGVLMAIGIIVYRKHKSGYSFRKMAFNN